MWCCNPGHSAYYAGLIEPDSGPDPDLPENVVARLWSAYGVNIIVLLILLLIVWIIGQVMQRSQVKSKESLKKG